MLKPWSHQHAALDALAATRRDGKKRALVVMASGLGKTALAALDAREALRQQPGRVLYLCHQNYILEQAMETYREVFGEEYSYGFFHGGADKAFHEVDFLFASFQSMTDWRNAFMPGEFTYVVVDESHRGQAPTYRPTIEYFSGASFLLGMTATPDRTDLLDIREIFGPEVFNLPLEVALAERRLTRVRYLLLTDGIESLAALPTDVGRISIQQLNRQYFATERDFRIVKIIREKTTHIENPRILVFCKSIKHAEHYARLLPSAYAIHSKQPRQYQDQRMAAFRRWRSSTLVTVDKLNEGIDVPEANVIVFLRSTSSRRIFFQQLGRGLRKARGKKEVLVLDFAANCERLEMVRQLRYDIETEYRERQETDDPTIEVSVGEFSFSETVKRVLDVIAAVRGGYTKEVLIAQIQQKARELGRTPTLMDLADDPATAGQNPFRTAFGSWNSALAAAGLEPNLARKTGTDAELIEQLRRKAAGLGRTPNTTDINEDSTMASTSTFRKVFGSLSKALEAAGLNPARRQYGDDELIRQLQKRANELGRPPHIDEVGTGVSTASGRVFTDRFGSWGEALEVAGFNRPNSIRTTEQLIADLQQKARELDRAPTASEMGKDPRFASISAYAASFGGWNAALVSAGLSATRQRRSREQLIADLQQKARELGRTLRGEDVDSDPNTANVATYAKVFGSWNMAIQAAGLEPTRERAVPEEKLLDNLVRYARRLSRLPSYAEMELGVRPSWLASVHTYMARFGTWSNAKRLASERLDQDP